MDELGAHIRDVADEAERGIRRRDRQQPRVLARNADRDRLVARLAVDGGDEVAVDLADQHHPHDLERLGIGDAKAVLNSGSLPTRRSIASTCGPPPWTSTQRTPTLRSSSTSCASARSDFGSIAAPPSFTTTDLPANCRM